MAGPDVSIPEDCCHESCDLHTAVGKDCKCCDLLYRKVMKNVRTKDFLNIGMRITVPTRIRRPKASINYPSKDHLKSPFFQVFVSPCSRYSTETLGS